MSDLVGQAVEILLPFAGAGAGAVAGGAAGRAGSELYSAAAGLLGKVRRFLSRGDPDGEAIREALEAALDEGVIAEDDLRHLVAAAGDAPNSIGTVYAKNVLQGSTTIGGDFVG